MEVASALGRGSVICAMFGLGLSACSPTQREQTVFPQVTMECVSQVSTQTYIASWLDGRITVEQAKDRESLLANFVRPNIEALKYVEPSELLRPVTVEAASIQSAGDIQARSETLNWGPRDIGADVVWSAGIKGAGVVVAVIDSGVDTAHPQLKDRIYVNEAEANGQPGVDDDRNGYIDDINGWNFPNQSPIQNDDQGHGTHVAGIIAATHGTGPIQGVAPEAKILPLDFMSQDGGNASDAVLAIDYAVSRGARVINASWSSSGCSKTLEAQVHGLAARGVLFVAAAGNSRNNLSSVPEFPAAFNSKSQITVGAVTPDFLRAGFSNYGTLVHVVAPGTDIISTYPGGRYAQMQGTSMAAPFVAGEAALLLSAVPTASVASLRSAIMGSIATGVFNVLTNGSIRASRAVDMIKALHPPLTRVP
jgi:subtilisin family serine protease